MKCRTMRVTWTVFVAPNLIRCERCGVEETLKLPIAVRKLTKVVDRFNAKHRTCEPFSDR